MIEQHLAALQAAVCVTRSALLTGWLGCGLDRSTAIHWCWGWDVDMAAMQQRLWPGQ